MNSMQAVRAVNELLRSQNELMENDNAEDKIALEEQVAAARTEAKLYLVK